VQWQTLTRWFITAPKRKNTISGKLLHSDPLIEFEWTNRDHTYQAKANLTGTYNFENILAAICIGHYFQLTPDEINTGLANYFPNNNRSQLTKTENNTVICDFYNANPSSMTAALNNLKSLNSEQKTAIIGDMFELGPEAPEQHQNIIKLALANQIDQVIFIGKKLFCFQR
jgi:UDP-N-acetylmuramoyl-tripeptide--D-alanyl-D-alanine ligase